MYNVGGRKGDFSRSFGKDRMMCIQPKTCIWFHHAWSTGGTVEGRKGVGEKSEGMVFGVRWIKGLGIRD